MKRHRPPRSTGKFMRHEGDHRLSVLSTTPRRRAWIECPLAAKEVLPQAACRYEDPPANGAAQLADLRLSRTELPASSGVFRRAPATSRRIRALWRHSKIRRRECRPY